MPAVDKASATHVHQALGNSSTARAIRAFDWSATPLGPMDRWPTSLSTAVALVVRSPAAMVLLWGEQGVMIYNDAYAVIASARHPEALGSKVRESWPEIADFNGHVMKTVLAGESLTYRDREFTVRRNGRAEQVSFTLDYSPVIDEAGVPAGVLSIVVETTARVAAERAVQASEARNRQILDSAIDYAIIAFNADGCVTRWNEGARRILGWTEHEMLGHDAERIFTPEDRADDRMRKEMHAALERGVGNDERWHVRKSGERFWANGEMTPILDDMGSAIGFVKVLRDRTEQHRAAEALRQSEESLRRAQEAGGVGTFALALDTDLLYGTAEFFRIFGLPDRQVLPASHFEALVIEEDERVRSTPSTRIAQAAPLDVEYRIRRASDGAIRWIARKAEYECDAAGNAIRMVGAIQDITERKADQRAIEESAAQFHTFAQTLPNHVWTSPPDGMLDWFNDRVYEFSGEPRGELDGASWTRIVHPEDLPNAGARWATALASGEDYETEFRLRRADGEYRWHLARAVPIRAADGTIIRWVGTNTDIHERKLVETESTRDRDRIWTLSQELMLVCDYAGTIAAVNPAATRMLGWSADEMVGRSLAFFVHPADVETTAAEVEKLAFGATTLAFENRYRTKDGSYLLLDWTAVPDNGRIHGVARNITGERAATEERERIWTAMNDLMATTNRDAILRSTNPAWKRLLGYEETELVSKPFEDFVDVGDHAKWLSVIGKLASGEPTHEFELRLVHKDSRRILVAWTAEHVGDFLYLVGRNVTDQRSVEDALRQAQKMEAVGQLTGGIAHDFNNLLQGITGSLALAQKRIGQNRLVEIDRFIGDAMGSARRAAALTHRLLAFSRRQPLDPRSVEVNPLVSSMEDLLHRTLGERVRLTMTLAPDLWLTKCDPNQLENAILNLAINSRDAMPHGGVLTIETANVALDGTFSARQQGIRPGGYVCVSVSDTGSGMSADTISKAFEPFFTTKPLGQGTGLGLSMIYGFARQSEGFANIYSEVGKGTTLKLYLPRQRGNAEPEATLPSTSEEHLAGSGETVLVVEDEPLVRSLIVEVLTELGYHALEASDGPEGLTALQSTRRIDLMITDIGLPGLNGRQIAEAGRLTRPDLKVLFMTGYAENAAIASGFLEAGMAMITKPFAMESLATKIREVIGGPVTKAPPLEQASRDEAARQSALDALKILDTEQDRAYDDLTRTAAEIFGVQTALISLVDRNRQWFKSRIGVLESETPREFSFCAHAIREPKSVFVVNDATLDPRFATNPLVTGDPRIRFYAGAPLITSSGHAIGTICAIGTSPLAVDIDKLAQLQFLADQVMQKMEARRRVLGVSDDE